MSSFDLISFIQNNFGTIVTSTQMVATAVIGAVYFRKKTRIETQTQEFEKMKAGFFNEALDEMIASQKITYTELYKLENYIDIAKRADEFFQSKKTQEQIPKQDFDWHIRFFESCGNVGKEELQMYWAQILAGEINKPGTYSYRTLECLKNLSYDEALLFQKICKASYDMGKSVILPQYDSILQMYGITYGDILKLEDCGLIKSDSWINGGFEVKEEYTIITSNEKQALIVKTSENIETDDKRYISIKEYLFTQSGKELYRLINCQSNIEALYLELSKQFPNYTFCNGEIIGREGEQLIVEDNEED